MNKSHILLMVLSVSVLTGCGKEEQVAKPEVKSPVVITNRSSTVQSGDVKLNASELVRQYNCTACHAEDKNILGPSWIEIANKYKGDATAEEKLMAKVSKGGAGVWGTTPMPGHDLTGTRQGDMKEMTRYVLSFAK